MGFPFCVLSSSHSNSEHHSCDFPKFHVWPIWWEYVCYEHHLIELAVKIVIVVKFWGFRYVPANWINLCNSAQQFRLMLSGCSHFFQSLYNYAVRKLDLSLIALTNCCSKFFKMVLFPPFQVRTIGNFAVKEIFIRLWESNKEWFWLYKPFLKI